jgi:hypothetical protein
MEKNYHNMYIFEFGEKSMIIAIEQSIPCVFGPIDRDFNSWALITVRD